MQAYLEQSKRLAAKCAARAVAVGEQDDQTACAAAGALVIMEADLTRALAIVAGACAAWKANRGAL